MQSGIAANDDPPLADRNITIVASTSLADVLTKLAREYSRTYGITVTANFTRPDDLFVQIDSGESADIYISEDSSITKSLKQRGLIDVFSLTTIAQNRLALVVPSKKHWSKELRPHLTIQELMKQINERSLFVIADPKDAILGKYSQEVLEGEDVWDRVEPFLIKAGDAKDAEYLVSKGEMAGIVYYSDSFNNPELQVVTIFPDELHDPVIYEAAVVASENMEFARHFLLYLKSDMAKQVLDKYGFIPS